MIEGYPKEITLKDGSKVVLRPMVREDKERLREFFLDLPGKTASSSGTT